MQKWLPFEEIFEDGIVRMKNHSYLKIMEVKPINYNLKSDLEKEAILNSYKTFLKTCDFDMQIIVQSNKEDLSKNISCIYQNLKSEKEKILNVANNYVQYIKNLNQKKESSKKRFFILLKNSNKKNEISFNENNIINELDEKYFKIKECLVRCGNDVINIDSKEQVIVLLESFINIKSNSSAN